MKIKLDVNAVMPTRSHATDAGLDLYCPKDDQPRYVLPNSSCIIDTGVHVQIPHGCFGSIRSKSGLNVKNDITSDGVIDEGYTGSIVVKLYNHGAICRLIEPGQKITQLIIQPCFYVDVDEVEELESTDRGDNGFGSTGK